MDLSRIVSEIDGDFSRKSQRNSHSLVFYAPAEGELGIGAGGKKKLEWWRYRADKEFWQYLQPCGYNAPTWRTDGQTDRQKNPGRQQIPRLRIASRGKIGMNKFHRCRCRLNTGDDADLEKVASFHASEWGFRIFQATAESTSIWLRMKSAALSDLCF